MVHPVQSDRSAITAAFCAAPKLATKVLMTPATDKTSLVVNTVDGL